LFLYDALILHEWSGLWFQIVLSDGWELLLLVPNIVKCTVVSGHCGFAEPAAEAAPGEDGANDQAKSHSN